MKRVHQGPPQTGAFLGNPIQGRSDQQECLPIHLP